MKFLALTLFVCLLIAALASALPADESLFGADHADGLQSAHGIPKPGDSQSLFKLKKLKKLLLLG